MKFSVFTVCLFFAFIASASDSPIYRDGWIDLNKNGRKDIYEDPARSVQKRVADLLKRMTLDEKIGQLEQAHMGSDSDMTTPLMSTALKKPK